MNLFALLRSSMFCCRYSPSPSPPKPLSSYAESLCIIFDGLDEYPPAYSDPSNYIYKIIVCQQLSTATVIVLSRPEAYEVFFKTSGASGFQAYELKGLGGDGLGLYLQQNIDDLNNAKRFIQLYERTY